MEGIAMKKQRIRHSLLTLLLVAAVLGGLGAIWYTRPVPQYTVTTVYSDEGETLPVIIDVTRYRSLLYPTKLKGTITIGNKVYHDANIQSSTGFLKQFKQKFLGDPTFYFAQSSTGSILDADWLYIYSTGKNLGEDDSDYIYMYVFPHGAGKSTDYYGPAKTAEEAAEIFARFAAGK